MDCLARTDANRERRRAQLSVHGESARRAAERAHADAVGSVVTEQARTMAWPLPCGPGAWDALASRHAADLLG